MSAAEVLNMARAAGLTLVLIGDRLTWRAEYQPHADLLGAIKEHRTAIIAALSAAKDPLDQPRYFIRSAATAAPEWIAVRDQYINHLMSCRACYAPTDRYCASGAGLRQQYNNTDW